MARHDPPEVRAARNARILALRRKGLTQKEIAAEVGLTPQSVLKALASMPDVPDATQLAADRQRARAEERTKAARKRIREHLAEQPGRFRPTELAAAVGLTPTELRYLLTDTQRKRLLPHEPGPRRRRLQEVSDDTLLARAKEMAPGGPVTTTRWDTERDRDALPSSALVAARFGSWLRFLEVAGVPHTLTAQRGARRFSDEDVLAAVATFLARPHGDGLDSTLQQWISYAEGNPWAPGHAALMQHIGNWPEVKRQAWAYREARRQR